MAAIFNLYVPDTGVDHKPLKKNPWYLIHEFNHCLVPALARQAQARSRSQSPPCSGAGATLQFIVIKWAASAPRPSKSSMLQGVVAVGVAVGAIVAAKMITLRKSVGDPLGIAMGIIVLVMNFVHRHVAGVAAADPDRRPVGFFVVPMNALLQHRGHILMGAGHSIAVQNFNENLPSSS